MASSDIRITIPKTEVRDDIVYYIIVVANHTNNSTWATSKRFSQFEVLHATCEDTLKNDCPAGGKLPPKRIKIVTSHLDQTFIEERRIILEHYLNIILAIPLKTVKELLMEWLRADKYTGILTTKPSVLDTYVFPNDAEITDVTIPSTRVMSDHVLYQIDVVNERHRKSFSKWTVLKRYTQFYEMDLAVREELFSSNASSSTLLPSFPSKHLKVFVDHNDEHFIEHRRLLLQNYLQHMIRIPTVARNRTFLLFLGVRG